MILDVHKYCRNKLRSFRDRDAEHYAELLRHARAMMKILRVGNVISPFWVRRGEDFIPQEDR